MPSHEQFNVNRTELLSAYDAAKVRRKSHKVPVYHGEIAESKFGRWLGTFLPKRYGVTAGYIVSQGDTGLKSLQKFDVIVYDILESPILWLEGGSENEKVSAIPVEYVRAVFEVKAALTAASAKKAMRQLKGLGSYLTSVDSTAERYPRFLPGTFFCMAVFFELRKDDATAATAKALCGLPCRGYMGAAVLRGDGRPADHFGRFEPITFEKSSPLVTGKNLLSAAFATPPFSLSGSDGSQGVAGLMLWHPFGFAQFAFDIVALLNGTYSVEKLSSFHGMPFGVG